MNQIMWLSYHETWEKSKAKLRGERLEDVSLEMNGCFCLTVCLWAHVQRVHAQAVKNEKEVGERGELTSSDKEPSFHTPDLKLLVATSFPPISLPARETKT